MCVQHHCLVSWSCWQGASRLGKVKRMATFEVNMMVEFSGEIEADSAEQAEQLAWTAWGESSAAQLTYDGVYSIDVEEVESDEDEEDEE